MCGIAGFWDPSAGSTIDELEDIASRMASVLRHRGPDDHGVWADLRAGLAMGHQRLAILDLSHEGHQPMFSADSRYGLVFNGEIYNFNALRNTLHRRGHFFRGRSDTEVLLAAVSEWGFPQALERVTGMFALALWDRESDQLHLARDRAGEKPLFYGWAGDVFLFGSELKALRAHPRWSGNISRSALELLVRLGYVPAPHCIYEDTCKLPPGCALTLSGTWLRARRRPRPLAYWSLRHVGEFQTLQKFEGTAEEAGEQLRKLLLESVARQMVADVPLGAFLSGGIDSSLIVALMQAQGGRPVKTFSIGFGQDGFDEAPFARAVARHLGTDHTDLYVQPEDLQHVIPGLANVYDEPLADPSQIPTLLLCQLARRHVKVSLSGDGGDELFGGYSHYRRVRRIWRTIRPLPTTLRRGLASRLKRIAEHALDKNSVSGISRHALVRLSNLSDVLPVADERALYQLMISPNRSPHAWLREGGEPLDTPQPPFGCENFPESLQRMSYEDFASYLPDDVLVKVDRAAMSVGLETRVPMLDHRIIEFAFRLPVSFKQRGNQGKWLLRQILNRYVPQELVDRPKCGFAAPVADWLRGPMRDWAEDLLDESRLRQEGFFATSQVRRNWHEHLSNRRDRSPGLWHVLMFQAWLAGQKGATRCPEINILQTAA